MRGLAALMLTATAVAAMPHALGTTPRLGFARSSAFVPPPRTVPSKRARRAVRGGRRKR